MSIRKSIFLKYGPAFSCWLLPPPLLCEWEEGAHTHSALCCYWAGGGSLSLCYRRKAFLTQKIDTFKWCEKKQVWKSLNQLTYSVTHLYENIAIFGYKESFFRTKCKTQPPLKVLWATFPSCFSFLSGELFGPDSQKTLIFRWKMQIPEMKILKHIWS